LIASFNSVSVSSVSAETACELDIHADTSVAGSNFILLEEPTRTVDVFGFLPELPPIKKVPIATVGTAWLILSLVVFYPGRYRNPIWGNALAMKFFAGSVACVYELPCFQQQYHLLATSVSGS
jgi:hypothetical protein